MSPRYGERRNPPPPQTEEGITGLLHPSWASTLQPLISPSWWRSDGFLGAQTGRMLGDWHRWQGHPCSLPLAPLGCTRDKPKPVVCERGF